MSLSDLVLFVVFDNALSKYFKNLLEVQILEGEMDFYNTSGFHTCPQNILFCWLVFFCTKAVEIIQKARNWKWRLIEILIMKKIKKKKNIKYLVFHLMLTILLNRSVDIHWNVRNTALLRCQPIVASFRLIALRKMVRYLPSWKQHP